MVKNSRNSVRVFVTMAINQVLFDLRIGLSLSIYAPYLVILLNLIYEYFPYRKSGDESTQQQCKY